MYGDLMPFVLFHAMVHFLCICVDVDQRNPMLQWFGSMLDERIRLEGSKNTQNCLLVVPNTVYRSKWVKASKVEEITWDNRERDLAMLRNMTLVLGHSHPMLPCTVRVRLNLCNYSIFFQLCKGFSLDFLVSISFTTILIHQQRYSEEKPREGPSKIWRLLEVKVEK